MCRGQISLRLGNERPEPFQIYPCDLGALKKQFALSGSLASASQGLLGDSDKPFRSEDAKKGSFDVEANVVADVFEFFGGLGSELKGESVPFAPDVLSVTVREPLGVVGAIIPWNVPMLLMALKVAPALVAGNAVVVKSAEEAPLAVLRICEILNRVLPPGELPA